MGNWSMEVGGSAISWPQGSGLLMQVGLERREKLWLNTTLEGRCLQSTAGYVNGKSLKNPHRRYETVKQSMMASPLMSRSGSERGHHCGGVCGNQPQLDAGCAEKSRQQQNYHSGQFVCGISRSETDAESKRLLGKSDCSRGISRQSFTSTVCHSEALSVVVFTGAASVFELSDPEEAAGKNPNCTASPLGIQAAGKHKVLKDASCKHTQVVL